MIHKDEDYFMAGLDASQFDDSNVKQNQFEEEDQVVGELEFVLESLKQDEQQQTQIADYSIIDQDRLLQRLNQLDNYEESDNSANDDNLPVLKRTFGLNDSREHDFDL